jgi:protein gp37
LQCTFSVVDGSLESPKKRGVRRKSKDRMFEQIDATWNPVVGCLHNCSYCWARKLATTRLKNVERYEDGFTPKIVDKEFRRRFHNKFVFACDMGDLFGRWVPYDWIRSVIIALGKSPSSDFLFLTKNPSRYSEFLEYFPKNVVLGATIETDRNFKVSDAPKVEERYDAMVKLPWKRKLVSVEPIMNFDLERMVQRIRDINPAVVYVGYDNYCSKLPEPTKDKTMLLVSQLQPFTRVRMKNIRKAWYEA